MRAPAAFTLFELIIVMAIGAVLMAIAAPRVDLARYRMDAAARQIESVLQQAQRNAVQGQQDIVVTFDTVRQEMQVIFDANNNRTPDAGERQTVSTLFEGTRFVGAPAGIHGTAVASITGQNIIVVAGRNAIIFRRNGAASSNLEIYLGSTSEPSTHRRALSIVQATGRAQLYRQAGAVWKREGI